MTEASMACELCEQIGGQLLWTDAMVRVVWAPQPDHPGLCRVIYRAHAKEMTDLGVTERSALMGAVFAVERALIEVLRPDKINLASFGNLVPHLHWHVVPRFRDDPHFPNPVWGVRQGGVALSLPTDFEAHMRAVLSRQLGPA